MNSCLLEIESTLDADFDDYSSDFDGNSIENNQESKNIISFYNELEPIIRQGIKNYFCDKILHDGRQIENNLLDLPYYSSLVFNTNVSDGVVKAYLIMEDNNFIDSDSEHSTGDDVRFMINLIKNIQKRVPQEFVGGMILMHLELVEGMEVW
jgi:hypothetical protein